jgi:hypothetical protein
VGHIGLVGHISPAQLISLGSAGDISLGSAGHISLVGHLCPAQPVSLASAEHISPEVVN